MCSPCSKVIAMVAIAAGPMHGAHMDSYFF